MKYLKYALGIVAVLFITFLLFGLMKPKLYYECEIMVEKPVAESWAVTQDEEKMSEWLPGFLKIENVSGTPGTVGSVSNVYFEEEGQEIIIRETITEIVPEESISMSYASDFMDMDYRMTMTAINGKTKVSSSTTAMGNGIISKSLLAIMGNSIIDQEETNLMMLKKTIENNNKNYFPN